MEELVVARGTCFCNDKAEQVKDGGMQRIGILWSDCLGQYIHQVAVHNLRCSCTTLLKYCSHP